MSRFSHLIVILLMMMSAAGAVSSTTSAVTWHNTGSTGFTATSGSSTLSSNGTTLSCSGATMTAIAPTFVIGSTFDISGTVSFSSCVMTFFPTTLDCSYKFTGLGALSSSVTTGSADLDCNAYQFSSWLCRITGSVSASYVDASGSAPGKLTWETASGLSHANSPGACPMNGIFVHRTHSTFTVTAGSGGSGSLGPIITRTA